MWDVVVQHIYIWWRTGKIKVFFIFIFIFIIFFIKTIDFCKFLDDREILIEIPN